MYTIKAVKSGYRIIHIETGIRLGFYKTLKAAKETLGYINKLITKR